MADYRLTFDFGSGSVKAALSDSLHRLVDAQSVPYETTYPRLGWATQKPADHWAAMCDGVRTLLMRTGILPQEIAGIAISHTASTIIFVDANGVPLTDCVMWMDGRAEAQAREINAKLGAQVYDGKKTICKLLWFLQNAEETVNHAAYMLDVAGYLFHRLTGEFAYEFTAARSTCLMDVETRSWNEQMFRLIGFPRRLIPQRLVASTDLVGTVTSQAADQLGLCAGIPVFGGCSDHATAELGTGCHQPGDAHIYVGTSAWLAVTTGSEPLHRGRMPSPLRGMWYHFYDTDTGGACLEYLISNYYGAERAAGADVYKLMNEEIRSVQEYGNDEQVVFLPFLAGASAPISNTSVRATLLNLKRNTTRRHISRAVIDGICFNLRWMRDIHQAENGWDVNFLRGIGGGMCSDVLIQTMADTLQTPITPLENPRFAGNLGLASCIDVGLGDVRCLENAAANVRCGPTYYPRPEMANRYDRLYQMYRKAYYALESFYAELNQD